MEFPGGGAGGQGGALGLPEARLERPDDACQRGAAVVAVADERTKSPLAECSAGAGNGGDGSRGDGGEG